MRVMPSAIFLLVLLLYFSPSTGYKVFVYSAQMSHSHVAFMGHIADALAQAGHNVTVLLPAFMDNVTSTGVKLARAIVRPRKFSFTVDVNKQMRNMWEADNDSPAQLLKMVRLMSTFTAKLCEQQLSDEEMVEELRKEKFDLGFGEIFDQCSIAYMEKIGVRSYISVFSANIVDMFARPFAFDNNPSYVPGSFSAFSDEMTYWQRAQNLLMITMTRILHALIYRPKLDEVFRQHVGNNFDIDEKIARSSFLFVNSEEFTEFPRPIDHRVVYIGGIGAKRPKQLPEEYQKIMDRATEGVVFVSFGSVMKGHMMPSWMKNAFMDTFRKFPKMTFLWKYDVEDDIGKDIPNLVKVKWAPQNDLFGHPNFRAFISHGGMNSMTEATHAGIPVIVIPLFGDQLRNAKMVSKRGLAYTIDKHNVTVESLTGALNAILNNSSYKESAQRLAAMIRAKPTSAKERLLKYSDFAEKFGFIENIDSAARKLNFFQYYLLDVILPAVFILLLSSFLGLKLLSFFVRHLRLAVTKIKKD